MLTELIGYQTYLANQYTLRIVEGSGVKMVYSCLGLGVMSFWTAFVTANTAPLAKKLKWLAFGLGLLWLINVLRITLLLIAATRSWRIPLFEHHTWFNGFAYLLIFVLIWLYDKQHSTRTHAKEPTEVNNANTVSL